MTTGTSGPMSTRVPRTVTPLAPFLCPPGYAGPRGVRALAREGSAVSEAARYAGRTASARIRRSGTAYAQRSPEHALAPVVLVPGLMAGDGSLRLMSRQLRALGYRTYRSLMHANVGCTQRAADALERRVESVAERRGRKVSVVGHSLGGLLARRLAGRRPDLVDGIVTLGSPLLAPGATHPLLLFDLKVMARLRAVGLRAVMGEDCTSGECARLAWEQTRVPLAPTVSFTSVYSRRDGIVDWRSCLDPAATTVEVATSHVGMAFDPLVLDVVSSTLAAGEARSGAGGLSRPATSRAGRGASEG
jgi:pimeloyl-ACP methyl ester carboxylesterase